MPLNPAEQRRFLEIAESLKPVLKQRAVSPRRLVEIVPDPDGFQGWAVRPAEKAPSLVDLSLEVGQPLVFDFGEHITGSLTLNLDVCAVSDSPIRLKVTMAEVPAEAVEPFDPHVSSLSRAWMQDEIITVDILPAAFKLPLRHAFCYVKIELLSAVPFGPVLKSVLATALTSADEARVKPLPASVPADLKMMDEVALRTLRNCMQTVFEDGPKRDRRLWLGDMRLQAMADSVSFQNYDLVKRCLYLFGALCRDDGIVNSDIYEAPQPHRGACTILDYSALFADTLLTYTENSGDVQTARDLWPVVLDQLQLLQYVDESGLFHDPGNWWLFIDWQEGLDKQACEQAILIIMIRTTLALAKKLGHQKAPELASLPERLEKMIAAARGQLFDARKGVFVSGKKRQISWASQAWMTLAEVLTPAQHAETLRRAMSDPAAVGPAGPYLYHVVVHALLASGLREQAVSLMRDYWGQMIKLGASTFWEVFDPKDQRFSPYRSCLMNSYCHAWSCTPTWFIRGPLKG